MVFHNCFLVIVSGIPDKDQDPGCGETARGQHERLQFLHSDLVQEIGGSPDDIDGKKSKDDQDGVRGFSHSSTSLWPCNITDVCRSMKHPNAIFCLKLAFVFLNGR